MNRREMEKRIKDLESAYNKLSRSVKLHRELQDIDSKGFRERLAKLENLKLVAERLWRHLHSDPQPPEPPWR